MRSGKKDRGVESHQCTEVHQGNKQTLIKDHRHNIKQAKYIGMAVSHKDAMPSEKHCPRLGQVGREAGPKPITITDESETRDYSAQFKPFGNVLAPLRSESPRNT